MFNIKTDRTLTVFLLEGMSRVFFDDIDEIVQLHHQKQYDRMNNSMKIFQETWKHNIAIIANVGPKIK